jgi:hypothetical protein
MAKDHPIDNEKRKDAHVFEIDEEECVWMKARVVNFKLCDHGHDCLNCPFDKAMHEAWEHGPDTRGEKV